MSNTAPRSWTTRVGHAWKTHVTGLRVGALLVAISAVGLIAWWWRIFRPSDAAGAWAAFAAFADLGTAIFTGGLAVFALRGLRSLKLTRTEMINRATREARLSAIQRLEEFAGEIIPMNNKILSAMSQHRVPVFLTGPRGVEFDPDPDPNLARAWVLRLPSGMYSEMLSLLNRLEAWCVYFTTGIAAPDLAFGPAAPLLRLLVGQYYAALIVARTDRGAGKFPNVVALYRAWSDTMDAQELTALHADLVAQIDRKRSNMAVSALPGTIGSEIE